MTIEEQRAKIISLVEKIDDVETLKKILTKVKEEE